MLIQLMMVHSEYDYYLYDQVQMLMMMYHYMDKIIKMKKIHHQLLLLDYYQMVLVNSKVENENAKISIYLNIAYFSN